MLVLCVTFYCVLSLYTTLQWAGSFGRAIVRTSTKREGDSPKCTNADKGEGSKNIFFADVFYGWPHTHRSFDWLRTVLRYQYDYSSAHHWTVDRTYSASQVNLLHYAASQPQHTHTHRLVSYGRNDTVIKSTNWTKCFQKTCQATTATSNSKPGARKPYSSHYSHTEMLGPSACVHIRNSGSERRRWNHI
jgi:hypothetical protein